MTMTTDNQMKYGELEVVNIRLVKEPSILSETPIDSPKAGVELISKFLSEFDREAVCVFNLTSDGKPLNMNIVSIGTLNSAIISPRDVLKSSILSNAAAFIVFHCHPSGNPRPSREDAITTGKLRDAGALLDIRMLDHIVVACGSGKQFSFLENGLMQRPDIVKAYDEFRAEMER